jgi:hypothetical protein
MNPSLTPCRRPLPSSVIDLLRLKSYYLSVPYFGTLARLNALKN